jgi:hypothetical protein
MDGILSNLISQGIWEGGKNCYKSLRSWSFSQVFGTEASQGGLHLAYASLTPPVAMTADGNFVSHVFSKTDLNGLRFSMAVAINGCEVRAIKYLAESIAANAHNWAVLTVDDEIRDRQDLSFVSFGLTSNCKTRQILDSSANPFIRYEHPCLVTKLTGRTVVALSPSTPKIDFGAIIKIHPSNLPERTWICCGGYGEWGTSGAAWYLARKWRDLRSKFGNRPFAVVVRVTTERDESLEPIIIAGTPDELERQVRGD